MASDTGFVDVRRRPLSQRGAATRRKLLDASIQLLSQNGYAATTTQAVTELAGVSRGSLLHQFQTRLDLIVATAQHAMDRMMEASATHLEQTGDPLAKLEKYPDVLWLVQTEPPAMALTEIVLAARWDSGLSERLVPVISEVEKSVADKFAAVARQYGLADLPGLLTNVRILIAATRGLAIERTVDRDQDGVRGALDLLKRRYLQCIEERLPEARRKP